MNTSNSFAPSPELKALFRRLGVNPKATANGSDEAPALCIVASIANLAQIEHAHGAAFARLVRYIVNERARTVFGEYPGFVGHSGNHILFVFDTVVADRPPTRLFAPQASFLIERIQAVLANDPVVSLDTKAYPVVSISVPEFSDAPFDIEAFGAAPLLSLPWGDGGRRGREQFDADTRTADRLLSALAERRLCFEWQPICDARDTSAVLYYEALLCERTGAGLEHVGFAVQALERLGLTRRLDQWVVESVIEALRMNPGIRLACNVSAQSARLDPWWSFVVDVLSEEPDIASRLVLEITETAPLFDLEAAQQFVGWLQRLGCRIALDDVGDGYSSMRCLAGLAPDIAKISRGNLVRAARDAQGADFLRQLVAFAKTCAATVVIEGIESDADVAAARLAGASGLQGYLFVRPDPGTAACLSLFEAPACERRPRPPG
ncbi:EAL domain-containing protein [Paraburkholderia sp. SOS3]|uniref:EAL domain-containing protein n=1 Tax=Paraburkholderia sp. SOS3 TaxID=1926494 RepID=UPI0009FA9C04|nr:EAL domain-containing protein [Paraburkholderia sp. SOS3]